MDYTVSQIEKRYNQLFKDIKEMISSSETTQEIFNIGSRAKLHIDQRGELADETGLLMLGLTKPNEYVGNLKKRLGISQLLAEQIAKEINEKVLYKIRDSVKEMSRVEMPEEEIKDLQEELKEEGLVLDNTKIDSNLDRKRMLSEIEDPEKINKRVEKEEFKEVEDKQSKVSVQDIKPSIEQEKKPAIYNQLSVQPVEAETIQQNKEDSNSVLQDEQEKSEKLSGPINFVQDKLKKPDSNPMKERNVTEEGVVVVEKKEKPTIDPYREPIE